MATVLEPGMVRSNKAVNIDPHPQLAPVTDSDVRAIEIGAAAGIRHYCLSFASVAADVELMRALLPEGSAIISKIESRAGVRHRDEIIDLRRRPDRPGRPVPGGARRVRALLPKGDRAPGQPLEPPGVRGHQPARVDGHQPKPTIAEMNDIANTLLDGVHGWCWRRRRPSGSTRSAPSTQCCAASGPLNTPRSARSSRRTVATVVAMGLSGRKAS